jgi:hypothetical protein
VRIVRQWLRADPAQRPSTDADRQRKLRSDALTAVPYGPLWCWSLQGEDAVFFSQETIVWEGTVPRVVDGRGACVARCEVQTVLRESDDSHTTPPVQCGEVAGLDHRGRLLCDWHMHEAWTCARCGTFLPSGEGGYCAQACAEKEDA